PRSSSAAMVNFVSQSGAPITSRRLSVNESRSAARATTGPTPASIVLPGRAIEARMPYASAAALSITPRASRRTTLALSGAATVTVAPPSGSTRGSMSIAVGSSALPLHCTVVPAALNAASQSRSAPAGGCARSTSTRAGCCRVVQRSSASRSSCDVTCSTAPCVRARIDQTSQPASSAITMPRSTPSAVRRIRSAGERIDDQVDAELCRILLERALRLGVEVPLGAVVLVAVQQADTVIHEDRVEMQMEQIVAPSVQLVVRVRRPILEHEEAAVDLVIVRHLLEPAEQPLDLLRRRLVEDARDVMVVVVHHHEAAALDVPLQVASLRLRKAHGQVAGQPHERIVEQLLRIEPHTDTGWGHVNRRVARHGVDQVLRQCRCALPVSGRVLGGGEDEATQFPIPLHSTGPRMRAGGGSSARRARSSAVSTDSPRRRSAAAEARASATSGASRRAATRM